MRCPECDADVPVPKRKSATPWALILGVGGGTLVLAIAAAAIPVAVVANFVRVLALVLITYYFGDAVAQGFLHDFAGLLMFSVALLTIFGVDQIVAPLIAKFREEPTA